MIKLPRFTPGQPVRASDIKLIADAVDRIWASSGVNGIELIKGNPWRIRQTAGGSGNSLRFNGPVWQIYVYRPTGDHDYHVTEDPSAIFLTGPFTYTGTLNTRRIARLKWNGSRTVPDSAFAYRGGIDVASGGEYTLQRMAKVPSTGAMLFMGQSSFSTWLDGENGVFWAANQATGERLFSPWASVESVAPGYRDDAATGIASRGDTIATSYGIISSGNPGLMLFDTSGNPVETSPGNYVFKDSLASSYFWIVPTQAQGSSSQSAYTFATNRGSGTAPYIHQIDASASGGVSLNAQWSANLVDTDGVNSQWTPVSSVDNGYLYFNIGEPGWEDFAGIHTPTTSLAAINARGSAVGPSLTGSHVSDVSVGTIASPLIVLGNGPENAPGGDAALGDLIFQSEDGTELYLFFDGSLTSLSVSGGDFNATVSDAKYFRQRNDGTHQIIVAGEFTTYKGQAASYLVFIDQDGNRLDDLEWP